MRLMSRISRILFSPFQRVREFLYQVPDDTPLGETIGSALGSREGLRSLWEGLAEHLEALRWALFRSVLALSITTGLCFFVSRDLMKLLAYPVGHPESAANVGMQGGLAGTLQKMMTQGADGLSRPPRRATDAERVQAWRTQARRGSAVPTARDE
jgi:hypothetical protein